MDVNDKVKAIVAGAITRKEWRSSALNAAKAYATNRRDRAEQKAIEEYVRAQYDAAGAGYSGRWQG